MPTPAASCSAPAGAAEGNSGKLLLLSAGEKVRFRIEASLVLVTPPGRGIPAIAALPAECPAGGRASRSGKADAVEGSRACAADGRAPLMTINRYGPDPGLADELEELARRRASL